MPGVLQDAGNAGSVCDELPALRVFQDGSREGLEQLYRQIEKWVEAPLT